MDYIQPIKYLAIEKLEASYPSEKVVRLYCTMSYDGGAWNLQLRGKLKLKSGHESMQGIMATAHLYREELTGLRDQINAELERIHEQTKP